MIIVVWGLNANYNNFNDKDDNDDVNVAIDLKLSRVRVS